MFSCLPHLQDSANCKKMCLIYKYIAFAALLARPVIGFTVVSPASRHNINLKASKKEPPSEKFLAERRLEREHEILDMGGDPSFLTDEMLLEDEDAPVEEEQEMMASMPMSLVENDDDEEEEVEVDEGFLWDGEVDENAYFD